MRADSCYVSNFDQDQFTTFAIESIKSGSTDRPDVLYSTGGSAVDECSATDEDSTPVFLLTDMSQLKRLGDGAGIGYLSAVSSVYEKYGSPSNMDKTCSDYYNSQGSSTRDILTLVMCNVRIYDNTTEREAAEAAARAESTQVAYRTTQIRSLRTRIEPEREYTYIPHGSIGIEEASQMMKKRNALIRSKVERSESQRQAQREARENIKKHQHYLKDAGPIGSNLKPDDLIDSYILRSYYLRDSPLVRQLLSNAFHFAVDDYHKETREELMSDAEALYDHFSGAFEISKKVIEKAHSQYSETMTRKKHLTARYVVDTVSKSVLSGINCLRAGDNTGVFKYKKEDSFLIDNHESNFKEGDFVQCVPSPKGTVLKHYLSNPFGSAGFSGFSANSNNNFNLLSIYDWMVLIGLLFEWIFGIDTDVNKCRMPFLYLPDKEHHCKYPIIFSVPNIQYPYGFDPSKPGCSPYQTALGSLQLAWYLIANDYLFTLYEENPRLRIMIEPFLYSTTNRTLPPNMPFCFFINLFTLAGLLFTVTGISIVVSGIIVSYRELEKHSRMERNEYMSKLTQDKADNTEQRLQLVEFRIQNIQDMRSQIDNLEDSLSKISQAISSRDDESFE